MKSMTIMPPMSRSLSWRTTSSAASRLVRVMVASSWVLPRPTFFPEFTSITVMASVSSITSEPPDARGTRRLRVLRMAVSTPWASMSGASPWYSLTRSASSGEVRRRNPWMRSCWRASSTSTSSTVSLSMSRMTLSDESASL